MEGNNNNWLCEICARKFKYKKNLLAHKRTKHNIIDKKPISLKCKGKLNCKTKVNKHLINEHNYTSEKSPKTYQCEMCGSSYSRKNTLQSHIKNFHKDSPSITKVERTLQCYYCLHEATKEELLNHYTDVHQLGMVLQHETFVNFDEFSKWKKSIELDTKQSFIQTRGCMKTVGNIKHHYYKCHRSGHFKSQGQGKRHLKIQGSKKINAFCPAYIKVREMEDGACYVDYMLTHVDHKNELVHLSLTKEEREGIADKIASNVPYDTILAEIRNSVSDSSLERIHLLTRKDLHNIRKEFDLFDDGIRHRGDQITIECWAAEVENVEGMSILSQQNPHHSDLQEKIDRTIEDIQKLARQIKSQEEFEILEEFVKSLTAKLTTLQSKMGVCEELDENEQENKEISLQFKPFSLRNKKTGSGSALKNPSAD